MIIDGKALAKTWRSQIKARLEAKHQQRPPSLAVILVGDDPGSHLYVSLKSKDCAQVGIESQTHVYEASVNEDVILEKLSQLNGDPGVDGILVQLPLPAHLNSQRIINAIDPKKDVDGLSPLSQGLLVKGQGRLLPCTPGGIMYMLAAINYSCEGKVAAVVGRSQLVGAPLVSLLRQENATIIHIHSYSSSPHKLCAQADLLVAAAGVPGLIKAKWVKEGATVIDVGINKQADGTITGDVDFSEVVSKCGGITPVPGGVGPLTRACLLHNCLLAYGI